jgi:hypothetical protein
VTLDKSSNAPSISSRLARTMRPGNGAVRSGLGAHEIAHVVVREPEHVRIYGIERDGRLEELGG